MTDFFADTVPPMRTMLRTGEDFDFCSAVCSYGFFMLAPNRWDPSERKLITTIALDDSRAVTLTIKPARGGSISVRTSESLSAHDHTRVKSVVRRMLRLNEDLTSFHERCTRSTTHRGAIRSKFGRLFRSATLFEDIVKVICTCNVAWRQTTSMVSRLVNHWGIPASTDAQRAFPSAEELARVRPSTLRNKARVGYRAAFISDLAHAVAGGTLDLAALERSTLSSGELYKQLRGIRGVGDYAAGNLCMLLGRYDRLAIDTETMRFLKARHPRRKWTPATVRAYYDAWEPYQFLAYWYELWSDYVRTHGTSYAWNTDSTGRSITSANARR